ncbi:MAG: dihydrodipicolinate synthase family protein [Planctomycetota bacterium]
MTPFELIAAPHTPFDANGDLAGAVVAAQAAMLRTDGVHGVMVAGSTGEGASLTSDERRRLAESWRAEAGTLRLWVHVGHQSVREAAALAAHAQQVGADAICAAPPSWFPLSSNERLVDCCAEIAAAAPGLPFFYYHIPVLSQVRLPMAPFAAAARSRIPNFAGIKYTHLDALDFQACRREHGDAVKLYWGCDELLVTGLALGAHGAVGSTYNFVAPVFHRLIAAWQQGQHARAQELQSFAALLVERLAAHGYMAAAKATMKYLGVDVGQVRAPLVALDAAGEAAVAAALDALDLRGMRG